MHCIVVGAGASRCAGAPLIGDFRKRAHEVSKAVPENFGHPENQLFRAAVAYWSTNFPQMNVEELYVMAELHQLLGEANPIEHAGSLGFADCVQMMIAKTLAASMKGPPHPAHELLAAYASNTSCSLLTLNWDLAVDNALTRLGAIPNLGYPHAYDMVSHAKIPHGKSELLKLHGSLNWWHCESNHLVVQRWEKGVASAWDGETYHCPIGACRPGKKVLKPLMVPPTSQKMAARGYAEVLKPVWLTAGERLAGASIVSIIGYSFPPTDVQFRTFVQRSLWSNKKLQTVEVVSEGKTGSAKQVFEDRYREILGTNIEPEFRYAGFEPWAQNLGG